MASKKLQQEHDNNKKFIFTSKNIAEITEQMGDGIIMKNYQKPWLNNEIGVRKNNLSFEWTSEEVDEYVKCAKDIHYFAEKYCQIKREDGSVGKIKLRPYQRDILDLFKNNRVILCASRQSGKCASRQTGIVTKEFGYITLGDLYNKYLCLQRKFTFTEKVKNFLYKLISQIETKHKIITI